MILETGNKATKMVILWSQHEEGSKDNLSTRSSVQSNSFLSPSNSSPTSPGSITNGATEPHHQRVNGRPPKPPSTPTGRSNFSTSSSHSSSGGSSSEHSERLVVAFMEMGAPRKASLSRSQSTYSPRKTSTPYRSNGGRIMSPLVKKSSFNDSYTINGSKNGCFSSDSSNKAVRNLTKPHHKAASLVTPQKSTISQESRNASNGDGCCHDQNGNTEHTVQVNVTRSPALGPSHACLLKSVDSSAGSSLTTARKADDKQETDKLVEPKKRERKRFYSLPRNWRGKAQDFIWSKGEAALGLDLDLYKYNIYIFILL